MSLPDLDTLQGIVVAAAEAELLPRFAQCERNFKADGSIVTEADCALQQRLEAALAARWPQYAFLGEESTAEEQAATLSGATQSGATGVWCLDPLDGTSNFTAGLPFFSVSLALICGGVPVLGLVYDPVRRECFRASRGKGAWLHVLQGAQPGGEAGSDSGAHRGRFAAEPVRLGAVPPHLPLARAIAAVDFKRLPPSLASALAAHPPYSSQRSLGSVALDWCWVAAGRFHVYLHGKQKLWDYAAGWLVLDEAGGHSASLDGACGFHATLVPRSALAALDERLFRAWHDHLAGLVD